MKKNPRNISYLFSISFHILVIILFAFIKISNAIEDDEYVMIGFGSGGGIGIPGAGAKNALNDLQKREEKVIKDEQKKVELPKAANKDNDNLITENKKKQQEESSKIKPLAESNSDAEGIGEAGDGSGGFGFEIDFGGKGMRRIYSYILPEYPEGVSKEIDVRLRFTIMPDGTVGKIVPLIKADAQLELAAINSLRQWRFEPLPPNAKKIEQTVVITFPYRLQ